MTRVVLVTGVGHSGSTLLGGLLEQASGIACLGELHQFPNASATVPHECSCGALASECLRWRAIASRWHDYAGGLDPLEHGRAAHGLAQAGLAALRGRGKLPDGEPVRSWCAEVDALYSAAEAECDVAVLVDSSKHVGRAALLAEYSRHDIRLLHLIRDPRGVAWSHRKARPPKPGREGERRPGRSVFKTVRRWNRDNRAAMRLLTASGRPGISLRYEQLVTEPDLALGRLQELLGMDVSGARAALARGAPLGSAHAVAGNTGVRRQPARALKLDERWRSGLTIRERLISRLAAHPGLMWHFGY